MSLPREFGPTKLVLLVAIAGASAVFVADNLEAEAGSDLIAWTSLSLLASFSIMAGFGMAVADESTPLALALVVCVAAMLLLLTSLFLQRRLKGRRIGSSDWGQIANAAALFVLAMCATRLAEMTSITQNVGAIIMFGITLVILFLVSPMLRRFFDQFIRAEEARTVGRGMAPAGQRRNGVIAGIYFTGVVVSGLASLLLLTVVAARANGLQVGISHQTFWPLPGVGLVVSGLLLLAVYAFPGRSRPIHLALLVLTTLIAISSFLASILSSRLSWLTIGLCVLVGMYSVECLRSSCGLLQRVGLGWEIEGVTLLTGVTVGLSSFWAATAGLFSNGVPVNLYWSLLSLISAVIFSLLLTITVCDKCYPAVADPEEGTIYGSRGITLHDQGLLNIMVIVLVWLPAFVAAHLSDDTAEKLLVVLLVSIGFISLFGSVYVWVVRYNTRHARFRRHRVESSDEEWPPAGLEKFPLSPIKLSRMPGAIGKLRGGRAREVDDNEWLDVLDAHIAVQNHLSMLILLGSVVGIIPLLNELKPNIPDIIRDA